MERLERYIHEMSSPEDALMEELTRTTNQRAVHPQMLSGHIQGRFLGMLVRMLRPHRVLEIGTFTGYSALSMAAGMGAGAILDTIEADDEQEELIRSFVERSGYGDRIRLHIGSALAVMPSLNETYDLVFIDGDKREYPAYYRMLMDEGRTVPAVTSSPTTSCGTGRWPNRSSTATPIPWRYGNSIGWSGKTTGWKM